MKILVIRFGSLGDVILTLPVLRDLAASTDGEIHYLVRSDYAPLLEPLPEIARVRPFAGGAGLAELRALAADLRPETYDLVLDLHGNTRSRLLWLLLAGSAGRRCATPRHDIRRRLMVAGRFRPGLGRSRPLPPVHERHRRALARELGPAYRAAPDAPYPVPPELAGQVAAELRELGLPENDPPVALAPGAAWPEKIWPRFAELLPRLSARVPVLLFGGPAEADLCRALAADAPDGAAVIPFCGDRPLPAVAAGLAACRAIVTGDTGLGHLAAAVGTDVVTLFGPTVPAFGFPPRGERNVILERELPCRPCSLHGRRPCRFGHRACLADIPVDAVLTALRDLGRLPAPEGDAA